MNNKSLYCYVTRADLSDGYVISNVYLKRPNKKLIKKKLNDELRKYDVKVNAITTVKIDVLEIAKKYEIH